MAKKQINLALQGGGDLGAFTWGVINRLLEENDIEITQISGISAGARDNLDWLWEAVAGVSDLQLSAWLVPFGSAAMCSAIEYSWPVALGNTLRRVVSPYA
jgi:NTE family protein